MKWLKKPFSLGGALFGVTVYSLCTIFLLGCSNDDNEDDSESGGYIVDHQIVQQGYNGEWCWLHPRACKANDDNRIILLMQPFVVSHSDYYQFLHESWSFDGGLNWSAPKSLEKILGEKWENEDQIRICDVTPQWHQMSKKILATGISVHYRDSAEYTPSPRETCYFYYNPENQQWSTWKLLKMPNLPEFFHASVGCSQWVDCPNGDILLPIYFLRNPNVVNYSVTVLRCHFDGENLEYIEHGNYLDLDRVRGFCEPSLVSFKGSYYLTLRNDVNGMVTVSTDGLHYQKPIEWMFNDSTLVNTENTQQHWVKSPKSLYLVYTSSGRKESEGMFRGRAPLFIAQFDEKNMCLLKETEDILIPNTGAGLGNFGAFDLDNHTSWVTASEDMDEEAVRKGADGRVFIAKIHWK